MATTAGRERRTPYVLLGMLVQGPASGYALRQRIEQSVGNFWQESYGQLYPALEALASSSLIAASNRPTDRRDTRVWRITKTGRAALARWLARPPTPQPERNELLLKVFFSDENPTAVMAHLERARALALDDVVRLGELRADVSRRSAAHRSASAWLATIDYGIAGQRALATWCAATLAALAAAPPKARRPSRRT